MLKLNLKKHFSWALIILFCVLLLGLWLRYENIKGANIVFDFDQYEDLFYTYKLAVDHKLLIIGRAIYGDPRIHHGVFYYYYNLIPFLFSGGNPFISAYWNIFFNAGVSIIIFFLARSLFKQNLPGILAAIIAATSFELIKFSNWLTIDTVTIFTIPLFYLGLWQYYQGKNWGLVLSAVFLGLSIQADLTFLYLIPVLAIYWIIFKPQIPNVKLFLISAASFFSAVSTLILTELKLNFSGVKTLLNFSAAFSETKLPYIDRIRLFLQDFGTDFSRNLLPQRPDLGILIAAVIILTALYFLFSKNIKKSERAAIYFLLLYLFSPAVTLLLGYHQKPWFLIGLPPAIALISGYAISKLRYQFLILPIIAFICFSNINIIINRPQKSYELFDAIYDSTSDLDYQLQVVDYTYQSAKGKPFAINAVTYPLYYNGMWAYLYNWYGKKNFGFVPGWLGGDQLHPYDLMPKATEKEQYFYLLISETGRIPEVFKNKGRSWAKERGKLIEEKSIGGFTVLKYAQTL
ncbi:MAG: hypothetical protein M1338_05115 [Patescibacteria group bacterium]|nr:hypothetical protein [Patescibacteria group bacterium]